MPQPRRPIKAALSLSTLLIGSLSGCIGPNTTFGPSEGFHVPDHSPGDHAIFYLPSFGLEAELQFGGESSALDAWLRGAATIRVDAQDLLPRVAADDDGHRVVHLGLDRTSILQFNATFDEAHSQWTGVTDYPARSASSLLSLVPFFSWLIGGKGLSRNQPVGGEVNGLHFLVSYEGRTGLGATVRMEFPLTRADDGGQGMPYSWSYELLYDGSTPFPKEVRFQGRDGPLVMERRAAEQGTSQYRESPRIIWPGSLERRDWTRAPADGGAPLFFPLDEALGRMANTQEFLSFAAAHPDAFTSFLRYTPERDAIAERATWEATFAGPGTTNTLSMIVQRTRTGPLPPETSVLGSSAGESAVVAATKESLPSQLVPLATAFLQASRHVPTENLGFIEFAVSMTGPPHWFQSEESLEPELATWKFVGTQTVGNVGYQSTVIFSALTGELLTEKRQRGSGEGYEALGMEGFKRDDR